MAFTYSKLAEVTVGSGGIPSFTFNNIPQNYNDLILLYSIRTTDIDGAGTYIRFNGTTSGYSERLLYGTGTTATSASTTTQTALVWGLANESDMTANTFASGQVYIPNYAGSQNKSVSIESVQETNATASNIYIDAGLWSNVTAINSVTLLPNFGNFAQHSTATLYGVKAEV